MSEVDIAIPSTRSNRIKSFVGCLTLVLVLALAVTLVVTTTSTPTARPAPISHPSAAAQTAPPQEATLMALHSWYRHGVGTYCSGFIFTTTCHVVVYPGTVYDMWTILNVRWQYSGPAAMAGLFGLVCLPISGVAATVCAFLGAVYGSYVHDQINWAEGEKVSWEPVHGECLQVSFYFVGPLPIGGMGLTPYNGKHCLWNPPPSSSPVSGFPGGSTGGGGGGGGGGSW